MSESNAERRENMSGGFARERHAEKGPGEGSERSSNSVHAGKEPGGPKGGAPRGKGGPPDLEGHVSRQEAKEKLFSLWNARTEIEEIDVYCGRGRTLAEDLFAMYNQPVVRASGMDGIAVKSADFKDGMPDTSNWKIGIDYIRADTGDDFDDAFDSVIRIESVTMLPGGGIKLADDVEFTPGMNVRPSGENIKKGTQVARAGMVLAPANLAAIVLGGYSKIKVYKKPVIGFIPSGNELVPAGSVLERGQNFDSNSVMVKTLLEDMGAEVKLHPIIKDAVNEVEDAVNSMVASCDVVILNAGTSKGSEDYCVKFLEENGNMLFHGVKSVPGRPMSITIYKEKPVINLSGPSVGALNGCIWLMAPVIDRMLSHTEPLYLPRAEVALGSEMGFPPFFSMFCGLELKEGSDGTLTAYQIKTRGPGSKGMSATLMADAYYQSEIGEKPRAEGEKITVFLAK